MKSKTSLRLLQGVALMVTALAFAPANASPAEGDVMPCPAMDGSMQARMAKFHQDRLDRLHDALKLTSTQQSAWQAYAKAEMALASPMAAPPQKADPAALAQFRADRAAEMAQRMAAVSKGTSALWKTLTPAQRTTFEQLATRGGRHRPGMMMGGRPPMPDQPPAPAPDAQ